MPVKNARERHPQPALVSWAGWQRARISAIATPGAAGRLPAESALVLSDVHNREFWSTRKMKYPAQCYGPGNWKVLERSFR